MSLFSKIEKHAVLVGRMSDTLGVDLVGASMDGGAPETTLRTAIYGCMGCKETDACEEWLASHETASEAPDYCRNKRLLDRLAQV